MSALERQLLQLPRFAIMYFELQDMKAFACSLASIEFRLDHDVYF